MSSLRPIKHNFLDCVETSSKGKLFLFSRCTFQVVLFEKHFCLCLCMCLFDLSDGTEKEFFFSSLNRKIKMRNDRKRERMFWRISLESLENVNNFKRIIDLAVISEKMKNVMHLKISISKANCVERKKVLVICYAWVGLSGSLSGTSELFRVMDQRINFLENI